MESGYLGEQRPLVTLELQALDDESLHGLGRGAVQLTEVWRQVAASNHEDNLAHRKNSRDVDVRAASQRWNRK